MRQREILKQVLYLNEVEQQGIATSGDETFVEFMKGWFGNESGIVGGDYKNNTEYFYTYGEPLKGLADIILMVDGSQVYLYELE